MLYFSAGANAARSLKMRARQLVQMGRLQGGSLANAAVSAEH
jgi:hypothetical protein